MASTRITAPAAGGGQRAEVAVTWSPKDDRPTLGGLLTVLAEGFALCDALGVSRIQLTLCTPKANKLAIDLAKSVCEGVANVSLRWEGHPSFPTTLEQLGCPTKHDAHDTSALTWILRNYGALPRISWKEELIEQAVAARDKLPNEVITVGLKHVKHLTECDSNAGGADWSEALRRIAACSEVGIVLAGQDPLPRHFGRPSDIPCTLLRQGSLVDQLVFISVSDCYLGMASGLASAAMFTLTPLAIFKHPQHDAEQMLHEFGEREVVPLWHDRQVLVRRLPTPDRIVEAWMRVSGK